MKRNKRKQKSEPVFVSSKTFANGNRQSRVSPIGVSNVPGTPAPPTFPGSREQSRTKENNARDSTAMLPNNKIASSLNDISSTKNFDETDINALPRETSGSDQLVAAIEDVSRKLNEVGKTITEVFSLLVHHYVFFIIEFI